MSLTHVLASASGSPAEVEHAQALSQAAHKRAAVALVAEEARLLPGGQVHCIAHAIFQQLRAAAAWLMRLRCGLAVRASTDQAPRTQALSGGCTMQHAAGKLGGLALVC